MAEILYEPTGCNCDGKEYTQDDINAAASQALSLASQGQTLGRDKYPHAYNDYEHFTFAHAQVPHSPLPLFYLGSPSILTRMTQVPYLEFPILANGEVYSGSSPGADRVIIGSIAEDFSSAVYCAVITHDGQRKNKFAECADDTLNLRGKGEYVSKARKGGKERKLLKRIDL